MMSKSGLRLIVVILVFSVKTDGKNIWETIKTIPSVRWMARVLEARGLTSIFDVENVTIFLPSSEGFFSFDSNKAMYGIEDDDIQMWMKIMTYGSQKGRVMMKNLPLEGRISSRLHASLALYVNTFSTPSGQITTINGATIIHADILTDNGVLHVVDRMIFPIASHMTIADYLAAPELKDLSFTAIILAAVIVPKLTEKTNNSRALHTSFSPNDSYLYPMPEYGKGPLFNNETILREVYQAHIIENEALFLPSEVADIPTKPAIFGKIRFYRRRDGGLYIANNRVHAKVVQANIPTINGVIHVIDNLLHYVYHNAIQVADSMADTQLFAQLFKNISSDQLHILADSTVTIFIPTDWAFSKIPLYWQSDMLKQKNAADKNALEEVLLGHVIRDLSFDSSQFYDGQRLTMANNQSVTLLEIEGDFYLQTTNGGIRSKIEVIDMGITNGVVHLINNVLFANDFTIWEALSDIPQLKRVHDLLAANYNDIRTVLNLHSEQPITVFLPSNEVLQRAVEFVDATLLNEPQLLLTVIKGHIITGQFSSSNIVDEIVHVTFAGNTIQVTRNVGHSTITVSGGHVTSKVMVADVFCSNGVLHVIDDILHLPTRTIATEMSLRTELGYSRTLINVIQDQKYSLGSKVHNYTVFVPHNDAFSSLPWNTISQILTQTNWTKEIFRGHVIPGEVRTLDNIPSYSALPAENNVVYVLKKNGKVFAVNNNIMAEVLVASIPAVNGWIHIIDRLLTVPYETVAEVMATREDVRLFHEMISLLPEYREIVTSSLRNVTLFVPSTRYINSLTVDQLARIRSNPQILKKLFYGHVLPNVRLDDVFLRQYPEDDYYSRSSYNISFKISKDKNGMFVGVGFDIQPLDSIGRATGCADGIIFVINGFLNYSPFTVLERLKREPGLSVSFEHMTRLAGETDIAVLGDPDLFFTFLMPDDLALDFFSFNDLLKLHSLPERLQHRTFWRHSINGSMYYYDDLKNLDLSSDALPRNVSVQVYNEAVYLKYRKVNSKIKQWNLIACNGVIHILMQFLYDVTEIDDQKATTIPSVSPSTRVGSFQKSSSLRSSVAILLSLQIFLIMTARVR